VEKSNNKKTKKPTIVCFGGGSQVPVVLLSSLKKYPLRVIGITSMTDSGGSGGYFRQKFEVLPPSDIRRHILALSNAPVWKKTFGNFVLVKKFLKMVTKGMSLPMHLSPD